MRFDKHVFFSALAVVLLAVLVCFRFFGDVIMHPDEFLFGASGDGLKNYFSVAYQVIHGEGTWFRGMLYPYGDHLIFADGQPLLTKILSWFIEPDVNNGPQIIAIMNLLMIGSLVITAWSVHRLLVWNYVNPWFAVPFSLTIAFLSPQLARFIGHYALAYTFFVPMSWLLIAGFARTNWPWLLSAFTSVVVLGFAFLHPYYEFIFVIFLGSVLGWELLIKKFRIADVKNLLPQLFALVAPLVLFMLYQKWVDPYTDRPTAPSGIFDYVTTFQSVFVPVADPFRTLFNSYFFRIFIPGSWEGNAYIGMVASFTAFASFLAMGKRLFHRKWKTLSHPILPETLKIVFIPGILTLLFAMGLFHKLGLYWLSDFITPIKQFRSLGRIAWIFYYTLSIWTVYHLYVMFRHFRSVNKGKYAYHISLIIGLCAFLWMLDAIVNIKHNKLQMIDQTAHEAFSDKYVSQWKTAGVVIEDHQAIMPLPFALIGSEKISLQVGHNSSLHAIKASFSSGLPIVGGALSRTSLDVTQKSAQLVSNILFPRPILDAFDQNKKLLFLQSDEPLTAEEQLLLSNAELVFQNADYRLYSTTISNIRSLYEHASSLPDSVEFSLSNCYIKPLEFEDHAEELWGSPSYEMSSSDKIIDTVFSQSDTLNISYWVKVDPNAELLPNRVYSIDRVWQSDRGIDRTPNLQDGWLFVSENLITEAGKRHVYTIYARGGTLSRIQLRAADQTIIHREGEQVYLNNIPLH
ncbi:MAG: hypothetical protein K9J17_06010 [Flavobacteriales bacterium]|nr:hypothetical protein [Flavobacteriales bacterium]